MGQTIEINGTRRIDDVLIIDTDRSLSGQDAEGYLRGEVFDTVTFPAQLAKRIFAADPAVGRVHVISNVVSLTRPAGWDDDAVATAESVVEGFFRFYPD